MCTKFLSVRRRCSSSAAADALLRGLDRLPCFAVPPAAVRVLHDPADWHAALLDGARRARKRACGDRRARAPGV